MNKTKISSVRDLISSGLGDYIMTTLGNRAYYRLGSVVEHRSRAGQVDSEVLLVGDWFQY